MTNPRDAFNQCHLGPSHPGEVELCLSGGMSVRKLDRTFCVACDTTSKLFDLFSNCVA
jgi:hypothetical protein